MENDCCSFQCIGKYIFSGSSAAKGVPKMVLMTVRVVWDVECIGAFCVFTFYCWCTHSHIHISFKHFSGAPFATLYPPLAFPISNKTLFDRSIIWLFFYFFNSRPLFSGVQLINSSRSALVPVLPLSPENSQNNISNAPHPADIHPAYRIPYMQLLHTLHTATSPQSSLHGKFYLLEKHFPDKTLTFVQFYSSKLCDGKSAASEFDGRSLPPEQLRQNRHQHGAIEIWQRQWNDTKLFNASSRCHRQLQSQARPLNFTLPRFTGRQLDDPLLPELLVRLEKQQRQWIVRTSGCNSFKRNFRQCHKCIDRDSNVNIVIADVTSTLPNQWRASAVALRALHFTD